MKQRDKTIVPRAKALNDALVDLGHKRHSDKRKKKLSREREERELAEYLEDKRWDDED